MSKYNDYLYLACKKGHLDIVKLMLKKGADVNYINRKITDCDCGYSCLSISISSKNIQIVKLLLNQPTIDINYRRQSSSRTPLMIACWEGTISCVKLLLSHKNIDLDLRAEDYQNYKCGKTALMYAILSKRIECAKLLIQSGCDVNINNSIGETAHDLALKYELNEIIKMIDNLNKHA